MTCFLFVCNVFLLVAVYVGSVAQAAEEPVTVPIAVAEVLNHARAAELAQAETILAAYTGAPHALVSVALANARLQRSEHAPEAERPGLWNSAAEAYTRATQLDPTLVAAQIGLARCAALRGDWPAALTACAASIVLDRASANELAFYADCAARAGDSRLAANLVSQAIIRYPHEGIFRQQEIALLVAAERCEEARAAVLALLAATPNDAAAWHTYAGAQSHAGGAVETSRIALEAAALLRPDDAGLGRSLAEAQLSAGQAPAAFATLQRFIRDPAQSDVQLVELAARAAADSDQPEQARRLLAAVPQAKRTRGGLLLAARLAAQANDLAAADVALAAVLSNGELDQTVIAWAGSLAERRGDAARAEALYRQADAQSVDIATLRLALLLQRTGRHDEAVQTLARYRAAHPDDLQLPVFESIISVK